MTPSRMPSIDTMLRPTGTGEGEGHFRLGPKHVERAILYVLSVPDWRPEEATPLAGFSPSLCRSAFLVRAITRLPASIDEPLPDRHDSFAARRICGMDHVQWRPQSPRAIRAEPLPASLPFVVVVLAPGDRAEDYRAWAASCAVPPIIAAERGGAWDGAT